MKYNKKGRISFRLKQRNKNGRLRICVNKTCAHIYAQILDEGKVLVSSSSLEKDFKGKGYNVAGAFLVGKILGQKAKKMNLTNLYFDRSGFIYHGRIKSLADGIREEINI